MKYSRLNKPLFSSISVLVLLFTSCVGCWGGDEYFRKTLSPTPEWRYLGTPPEKIDKLLAADFDTVYVTTIKKNIYSCYWASPYDTDCWVKVEKVPKILEDRCIYPQDTPSKLPAGKAIEVLQFQYCGSFAGNTDYSAFNYYLLDDGTVVQWGDDEFHLGPPAGMAKKWVKNITIGLLIGMGSGAIFVITVFFITTKRKWHNKSSQP